MQEQEREEPKRFRTILMVLQSCLICVLVVLVACMMVQINKLQGTAKVINYAGLVRGATQRLVKLEITEHPKDDMIAYLDEILSDLKYGNGSYDLVILDDESYQNKLSDLILYWDTLKAQIFEVRADGYQSVSTKELLDRSEVYFGLADETVFAAEVYSEQIAGKIRRIEIFSAVDMCILIAIILEQTVVAMRMRKKNIILEQEAYIDLHTGLKNKNMCQEMLGKKEIITEPTACVMFDINNLKNTNDTFGHLVGDKLIADFANAIKSVVCEEDFAGRCGGDEFMLILYHTEESSVQRLLENLKKKVDAYNDTEKTVPISYAQGFAVSKDDRTCTLKQLFEEADHSMYLNKQRMKEDGRVKNIIRS